jgi:hypothetical protein
MLSTNKLDNFLRVTDKAKKGPLLKDTRLGGKRRGKYYWDPEIIFDTICSFSKIGNDETKVSVMARTSTYKDYLLVSLRLRHSETL